MSFQPFKLERIAWEEDGAIVLKGAAVVNSPIGHWTVSRVGRLMGFPASMFLVKSTADFERGCLCERSMHISNHRYVKQHQTTVPKQYCCSDNVIVNRCRQSDARQKCPMKNSDVKFGLFLEQYILRAAYVGPTSTWASRQSDNTL